MSFPTYDELDFLRHTLSANNPKHYNKDRTSAGIFAITNDMVESEGTSETYISDLTSSDKPYSDFRFTNRRAYNFLESMCSSLEVDDFRLVDLAYAAAPYCGVSNVKEVLESIKPEPQLELHLATFCAALTAKVRKDQFLVMFLNALRHNYLRMVLDQ